MNDRPRWDTGCADRPPFRPGWQLAGLVLFGIGFGFVEAAVVVDLRAILSPTADRTVSGADSQLVAFGRLHGADPGVSRLMGIEMVREAATLAMLAGVGMAAGRTFLQRFSAFLIGFGIWDLCYYLFLNLLIGWPASVWTWDILFLLPVPWAAPVLAPALAAASMVGASWVVLVWEAAGRAFRVSGGEWAAVAMGGLILIAAFCWDWRTIQAGGTPSSFPWTLFVIGEMIGFGGFLHASWANRVSSVTPGDPLIAIAEADTT